MNIILYSTPTCPKCKILEMKLWKKGYQLTREMDEEVLVEKGLKSVPWLQVDDGELMDFGTANNYINELPEVTE